MKMRAFLILFSISTYFGEQVARIFLKSLGNYYRSVAEDIERPSRDVVFLSGVIRAENDRWKTIKGREKPLSTLHQPQALFLIAEWRG